MAAYVAHLLTAAGQLCWHIVAVQHFRSVQYTSFSAHLLAWCSMKTCVIKHKLCYAAFKSVLLTTCSVRHACTACIVYELVI